MNRKVGIIQPNYIPWRGYFDFLHEVDVFVFLDDVQYTVRDWRNRNCIRTRDGGMLWLTVPTRGGRDQLIKDVCIDNSQNWQKKHLQALRHNYGKAPFFTEFFGQLEAVYAAGYELLAELDVALTRAIAGWLGLETGFELASRIGAEGVKDERLLAIVKRLDGEVYLSGPSAQAYMRPEIWDRAGIRVLYKDYSGYPVYPQIVEPFEPAVSILDLLFMTGRKAPDYIWGRYRRRS